MARIESQALGGYYALPEEVIAPIASLIELRGFDTYKSFYALDPCAADGAAILGLLQRWFGDIRNREIRLFAAELEQQRADALSKAVHAALHARWILHSDAFRVQWETSRRGRGVAILYLNPPYDQDDAHGRLEHRFLERFTGALAPDLGILVFVVPHTALRVSAAYLAQHYQEIHCFRFPGELFDDYQQVVLVARRRISPLDAADVQVQKVIEGWALDAESIEELPEFPAPVLTLHYSMSFGLNGWDAVPFDVHGAMQSIQPGMQADGRGMRQYGLDGDMDALLGGKPFPVAMPPRPGHIAQALSAGIINGATLLPDTPALPPVLAKGVFDREFVTVEQKTNKDGEVTGVVQVQQPVLQLCVLDMRDGRYYDIAPGSVPSGTEDVASMNVADLLSRYRGSLVDAISKQCPVLHPLGVPAAAVPTPALARTLYRAQIEAVSATVKLLAQGENPFVIGEVGTGKSTIALASIAALQPAHLPSVQQKLHELGLTDRLRGVQRALIVCPPHLLQSWQDQVAAVLPGATVVVLDSVSDVYRRPESHPGLPGDGLTISILSRETAKLGHGIGAGLDSKHRCPRCGLVIQASEASIVKARARCANATRRPANAAARLYEALAQLLATVYPGETRVTGAVASGLQALAAKTAKSREGLLGEQLQLSVALAWAQRSQQDEPLAMTAYGRLLREWVRHIRDAWREEATAEQLADKITLLGWLFFASLHPDRNAVFAQTLVYLYKMAASDTYEYGRGSEVRKQIRRLLLLLPSAEAEQAMQQMKVYKLDERYGSRPWQAVESAMRHLASRKDLPYGVLDIKVVDGGLRWEGRTFGAPAAFHALEALANQVKYRRTPCGEPLFQAIPTPRRYPLARYIARHAKGHYDILIVDEGHEYAGDGSAQEIAVHRLTEMGLPTIVLTGSLMNGYASGLFRNLWALSRRFRQEFGRDEQRAFVTRYGYRKVMREPKDDDARKTLSFGAVTDRKMLDTLTTMRTIGEAPGVLPVLLLQHLLPIAVTIRKSDLDDAIPACSTTVEQVAFAPENAADMRLRSQADALFRATMNAIKQDRFSALSGKLFGALGQLPSFYDRASADAGNGEVDGNRSWEVRYPEACGGRLVAAAELIAADELLPKERWLIQKVKDELAEGRNVLVFIAHSGKFGLAPRLTRLLSTHVGETPIVLEASKVPTAKREAWINAQVVKPRKRILIVNPTTVQTGLNNLVWFSTAIWYENPSCNAIVFRQANGRLDRIGQTKTVRIFVPVYANTAQTIAQELLERKIMASEQVDGMDVAASLEAAGAGEERDAIDTLEMGRAIYAMLVGNADS